MAERKNNPNHCTTGRAQIADIPSFAARQTAFWLIALVGFTADLASKSLVFRWLAAQPRQEYTVIDGFFKLVMRENSGAAFSIAQGKTIWLIAVSVVAMITVVSISLFGRIAQRTMRIALAFFAAGIAGNLYDRIFNDGYVRDFLDVYWNGHHWPAFNIADSLLCTAVGLMVITNLICPSSQTPAHQQK